MMILIAALAGIASQPTFLKTPILPSDTPQSALQKREQGFEFVKISVSASGSVEHCEILVPSAYRDLDTTACLLLKKAKMAPAVDRRGNTLYGTTRTWVGWSIGGPSKPPVVADVTLIVNHLPPNLSATPMTKLTLVVDDSGKVETCDVATSSGDASLDKAACSAGVAAAAQIEVVKNSSGSAVRAAVPLDVGFSTGAPEQKR